MSPIVAAARINLLFSAGNIVIAALSSILVVRLLATDAYANYVTILAWITWGTLVGEAGIGLGFARFQKEAEALRARNTFYRKVLKYRLLFAVPLGLVIATIGPFWAHHRDLAETDWSLFVFVTIGAIVAVSLVGQLGYYALISSFRHGFALLVSQFSSLAKAFALVIVASVIPSPPIMALALLAISAISALLYSLKAIRLFENESSPIPNSIVVAAHRHGAITLLDKVTTAIGGGPFLLIVLAGVSSRAEIALLGLAVDFTQKVLAVTNIPMGNMVMPYLHHWEGTAGFNAAVKRVAILGLLVFLPIMGAVILFVPLGTPLLFGQRYADAAVVVLALAIPMFVESWTRMIVGFSLLAMRDYKFMTALNIAQVGLSLLVLWLTAHLDIFLIVVFQGLLQIAICVALLTRAWQLTILDWAAAPLRLVFAVIFALMFGAFVQFGLLADSSASLFRICMGVLGYFAVLIICIRYLVTLDPEVVGIMNRFRFGRADKFMNFIFHTKMQKMQKNA